LLILSYFRRKSHREDRTI